MVMFGDYDHAFLYRVRKDARMLQRKYDAGTIVILCSGEESRDYQGKEYGSYHLVGIAKWKYHELFDALRETAVDRNFLRVPNYFNGRYHVLRIFPKVTENWEEIRERPWLKECLYSKSKRECNKPIYEFLCRYYGMPSIPVQYAPRFDSLEYIRLIGYQTTGNDPWTPKFVKKFVRR
jgi:hypothetical protein